MTYYLGILDVGANGAWGVRIPDVPGCHGGGATPAEAIEDATSALREVAAHFSANDIPMSEARTPLDILQDEEAGFDAARGETFVMIPLLLDKGRSVKANISLDAGLLEAIDDEAKLRGLTRSSFLASAARDKIGKTAVSQAEIAATGERINRQVARRMDEMRRGMEDLPTRLSRQREQYPKQGSHGESTAVKKAQTERLALRKNLRPKAPRNRTVES